MVHSNPVTGQVLGADREFELDEAPSETMMADVPDLVRAKPYASLATAAAAGFVLGGGLASVLGLRILGLGLRTVLVPLLVKAVIDDSEDFS